jgi:hypothetical protein
MVPIPANATNPMDAMKRMGLVPKGRAGLQRGVAAVLGGVLLAGGVAHAADKQPKPWIQLKLEGLGFPGVSPTFIASGSSSLTVNFLDDSHLLVTFGLRALVPRIVGDPEDDEDRLVAAEIVGLPSGKVDARTEWHMHDHGRYLWALGGGRFLVRIGDSMYTMAPLANLAAKDPFARSLLPNRSMKPSAVFVSPDGGLLTLETVVAIPGQQKPTVQFGDQDSRATVVTPKSRTLIDFFRLGEAKTDEGGSAAVQVETAGGVQSPVPLQLPANADGYLWAEDAGGGRYALSFNPYAGKPVELGPVTSSCYPRLQMVSRSEFVTLTCAGADDKLKLSSFGLDGTETWEEPFGDVDSPAFVFAPMASRFAFSRVMIGTSSGDMLGGPLPSPSTPTQGPKQEVRVYQDASGDLLLKVDCSPAFKTGENFDLAANGMMLAVVQKGAVAIYKLPPLGKKDLEDMAEVGKFAPPVGTGLVKLARLTTPANSPNRKRLPGVGGPLPAPGSEPKVATSEAAKGMQPDASAETSSQTAEGQAGPTRKPPTLLKPGEKPEFKTKNLPASGESPP